MATFTDSKRYPQEVIDTLTKAGFQYVPSTNLEMNTHPRLAAARAALEAQACLNRRKIWDVGGHRTRHELNKRNVHCSQPRSTLSDVKRGDCNHKASDCDCVDDFDVVIMVHTAYYLTEDELWRLAKMTQLQGCPLYSVEHLFALDNPVGKMEEAQYSFYYSQSGQLSVRFEADDVYDHALPTWFMRDKVVSVRDNECIVRNYKNSILSSHLNSYTIVPVSSLPSPPVPLARHWVPENWNVIPGLVSVKVMVPMEVQFQDVRGGVQADFGQSNSYTAFCEGFPILGRIASLIVPPTPSQIVPVHVPRDLISYLQNGIGTTTDDMAKLRFDARAWVRSNGRLLPSGASVEYVKEVAAIAAFGQDRQLIESIRKHWYVHSRWTLFALAIYGAVFGGRFGQWVILCMFRRKTAGSFRWVLLRVIIECLLCTFILSVGVNLQRIATFARSLFPVRREFSNDLTLIESRESVRELDELEAQAVPGSVIERADPGRNKSRYYARLFAVFNHLEVQVFNTSSHNTQCAVVGRFLKTKPKFDTRRWMELHAWLRSITPLDMRWCRHSCYHKFEPDFEDQNFDEWIMSRKLPKQRKNYSTALKLLLDQAKRNAPAEFAGAYDYYAQSLRIDGGGFEVLPHMLTLRDLKRVKGWKKRKAFVKVEKTWKADKLPRVIVSSSDALQVFCGPAIHAFDDNLRKWFRWCAYMRSAPCALVQYHEPDCVPAEIKRLPRVHFTVGWTQAKLSRSINSAIERAVLWDNDPDTWYAHVTVYVLGDDNLTVFPTPEGVKFMANDFSSFDTTHSEHSWKIQEILMNVCCVRQDVIQVLAETTEDIDLTCTASGGKYVAHWNMCSGNPNTCNGNSAINGTVSQYLVHTQRDAFLALSKDRIEKFYSDLGFEPKVSIGDIGDVDYLSGIYCSDARGTYYWIPKVFRLAVKQCFVADPRPGFTASDYQHAMIESYQHYHWVPVLRSLVKLFKRIAGRKREGKVRVILDNDRNLWYAPGTTAVIGADIEVDFCRHYGLALVELYEMERVIESWDELYLLQEVPYFTACFHRDVPDYQA